VHGDAQTADTRLTRALARLDCDDLGVIHQSFGILASPRLPRKPDSASGSMLPAPRRLSPAN
jgi:hypothetical protein